MIKCEDCTFGFLAALGCSCTRLDDFECSNFNEETGENEKEERE